MMTHSIRHYITVITVFCGKIGADIHPIQTTLAMPDITEGMSHGASSLLSSCA
jgi:hypothetical protein